MKGSVRRNKSTKVVINAESPGKSHKMASSRKTEEADKFDATVTQNKMLLTKSRAKPAYLQSLNESEKQANFKIIDSMNKKISYLKNPRHKINRAPILMTTVSLSFL